MVLGQDVKTEIYETTQAGPSATGSDASLTLSVKYYESQQVGLAEVIDASEASLGGPRGQTVANVQK